MLPSAEAFYARLGGVPLARPPLLEADTPGRWLAFGETHLHLLVGDPLPPTAHFALLAGDAYEVVLDALSRAGVEVRPGRPLWDARRSFVRDPAGNLVELFDRPPPAEPR